MTYRVGELDQRITIERKQLTPDGMGGNSLAWVSIGSVWAHVRPKSGRETVGFERLNGETTYIFIVRNSIDVKYSDRIVWDGVEFNVDNIPKPKGRALYMEVEATSGVAQ